MAETVTVVNRTSKVLLGVWDGRHNDIPLGESKWTKLEAEAFKRQNPLMGSGDPRDTEAGMTGKMQYLIGIKENRDPITPVEQTNAVERWDRNRMYGARPSEVVPGDNGLYSGRAASSIALPSNTTFAPNKD